MSEYRDVLQRNCLDCVTSVMMKDCLVYVCIAWNYDVYLLIWCGVTKYYRKTSDSSRVPYTSRAQDTGRVRVQQRAATRQIGDRNELVEVLRRQLVCVEYMLGCYQHHLVFHALDRSGMRRGVTSESVT